MEYRRDEHRVHLVVYHLIWCPKRRKPVLVGDVAKDCRRLMAHELRAKYPHLRKTPSLWTRSYFWSTAGNVSSETIKHSIDAQKGM